MENYSIFGGTGFLGKNIFKKFPNNELVPKTSFKFSENKILYLISTTDNYNVFSDLELDVRTNLLHLCKLFNNIRELDNYKKVELNFVSSWFVYGQTSKDELPVNESKSCDPKGFYSITKYAAEKLVTSFAETYGIKYRILRICNVMGSGDKNFSSKKNALTWMIYQLCKDKKIFLYDEGKPIRDILHYSDVIEGITMILDKGDFNSVYNIGRGHATTIFQIIEIASKLLKKEHLVEFIESPKFHKNIQSSNMLLDNSKLLKLGFKPSVSIKQIVLELIKDFND